MSKEETLRIDIITATEMRWSEHLTWYDSETFEIRLDLGNRKMILLDSATQCEKIQGVRNSVGFLIVGDASILPRPMRRIFMVGNLQVGYHPSNILPWTRLKLLRTFDLFWWSAFANGLRDSARFDPTVWETFVRLLHLNIKVLTSDTAGCAM